MHCAFKLFLNSDPDDRLIKEIFRIGIECACRSQVGASDEIAGTQDQGEKGYSWRAFGGLPEFTEDSFPPPTLLFKTILNFLILSVYIKYFSYGFEPASFRRRAREFAVITMARRTRYKIITPTSSSNPTSRGLVLGMSDGCSIMPAGGDSKMPRGVARLIKGLAIDGLAIHNSALTLLGLAFSRLTRGILSSRSWARPLHAGVGQCK
jgi:hypothetical protein